MTTVPPPPDTSVPPASVAAALRARAVDCAERVFLRAGEASWTFAAAHREACRYANLFLARRGGGPFHVGALMDNLPAFVFAEPCSPTARPQRSTPPWRRWATTTRRCRSRPRRCC